jgi:hypothetical protein
LPKEAIGINDISAAAIGSTVGSGANDITFTFKSSLVTLGDIDDTADTFNDGSTNGGKSLPMWVEVVNNTGSNIDLSVDYYIDITADAVSYRLHFPEQVLVPATTYVWYFDKQGIAFIDSNLISPAVDINEVENVMTVVDSYDGGLNQYLVINNTINKVDSTEVYEYRNVETSIDIENTADNEAGISILQVVGHFINRVFQGATWALKTATSINWRVK